MSFRLYESAWVTVEGVDEPCQVHKEAANPAAFTVNGHQYDIDARPLPALPGTPVIMKILSIQDVKEAGLRSHYTGDIQTDKKPNR